jgi:hypothetical protein
MNGCRNGSDLRRENGKSECGNDEDNAVSRWEHITKEGVKEKTDGDKGATGGLLQSLGPCRRSPREGGGEFEASLARERSFFEHEPAFRPSPHSQRISCVLRLQKRHFIRLVQVTIAIPPPYWIGEMQAHDAGRSAWCVRWDEWL